MCFQQKRFRLSNLRRIKSIKKITSLKLNNHITQTKYVIIVKALVTWFMHVLWKRTKLVIWLGFQKKPPLTTKDIGRYGYKKTSSWFCACRDQGNIRNGSWIIFAQDIWPEIIHCFQALLRLMMEKSLLEKTRKKRSLKLAILEVYPFPQ